jgi:hypothetical protein
VHFGLLKVKLRPTERRAEGLVDVLDSRRVFSTIESKPHYQLFQWLVTFV